MLLIILPYIGLPKIWEDRGTIIVGMFLLLMTYLYVRSGRLGHRIKKSITETNYAFADGGENIKATEVDTVTEVFFDNEESN